jgi:MFS family permease
LEHRNYRLYFLGQLVSLTGSWLQMTALMALAYTLTQTSRWPAAIAAAYILPTCLFGAWGGSLADRHSKRELIFLAQGLLLLVSLLLAGLTLGGFASAWLLLGLATVSGLISSVDLPARMAFVVEMVGREDVVNAVALNSLLFNVARVVGPALGAGLLPLVGPGLCFLLNSLSYSGVLLALVWMDPAELSVAHRHQPAASLRDGLRFLGERTTLGLLLLLAGAMAFFGWPVLALMPALADCRLGLPAEGYGALLSALGLGALLAALLVASFATPRSQRLLLGCGVCLSALGLAGLAWAPSLTLALVCCTVAGMGLILFFATGQGVFQLSAGDHNRGMILGIWSMVVSGAQPLGTLLAGPAADHFGVSAILAFQAGGIAVAGLVIAALLWVLDSQQAKRGEDMLSPP